MLSSFFHACGAALLTYVDSGLLLGLGIPSGVLAVLLLMVKYCPDVVLRSKHVKVGYNTYRPDGRYVSVNSRGVQSWT